MRAVFALTTFLSAALLFAVEPVVGKMLLPVLGGAPEVWATCLLFFQVSLLVGYAYAHAVATRVPARAQPLVHAALLGLALAALPLRPPVGSPPPAEAFPMGWLLLHLARRVALPFVALSATGPLLGRWLHRASDGRADPYPLYSASNAGSLLALLAYPVLVEPLTTLRAQARGWSAAYVAAAAMIVLCGWPLLRQRAPSPSPSPASAPSAMAAPIPARDVARWVVLAFVPSSLLLGVTTFVTTDVAPVPLLWVVPLALYLVAFIIPFSARPRIAHARAVAWMPGAVLALVFTMTVGADRLLWLATLVHFGAFFVVALACHGELARRKPPPEHLTAFYLAVSFGGALGGVFNAIVAPLVFPALWEYPLVVALACAVRVWMPFSAGHAPARDFAEVVREVEGAPDPHAARRRLRAVARGVLLPLALAGLVAVAVRATRGGSDTLRLFVVAQAVTVACVVAWSMRARVARFAWVVLLVLAAPDVGRAGSSVLFRGRSFFATHGVLEDRAHARHLYVQGTTIHGLQSTDPARRRVAGAYYHATGPGGEALSRIAPRHAALIGLGVASLATYADAGQSFTFYEIDPVVRRIAEDPSLFTFVGDARARGAAIKVVLGDARVELARAPDASFDLLVLDAYTSDVVPTHLLTREAFAMYARKLTPGASILMNVSNRYLDLGRVVAAVAKADGWRAVERQDEGGTDRARELLARDGKAPSRWILLARTEQQARAATGPDWRDLPPSSLRPWTDDYVNILACLRF